jgi:tetratricopeptide (TPR) repeat protein
MTGAVKQAIIDFTSAIQLEPNDHRSFCDRATAYNRIARYRAALADANEAIRQAPDSYLGHDARGWAYSGLARAGFSRFGAKATPLRARPISSTQSPTSGKPSGSTPTLPIATTAGLKRSSRSPIARTPQETRVVFPTCADEGAMPPTYRQISATDSDETHRDILNAPSRQGNLGDIVAASMPAAA